MQQGDELDDGVESLDDDDVDELMGFLEDELISGGTGRGRSLAAGLASVEHSVPGGFGSVHQPELAERERRRPLLQDAAS